MTHETGTSNPHPPPVDRLSQLWRRINEHKMVQWCVAYIAVAYAVQHAVVLTGEAFEWPAAVLRVSMLLMVLGLPVVLTLAWYHGERASRHFSTAELTIISLLLVIGSGFFYVAVQPHEEVASSPAPTIQQAGVTAARSASLSPSGVSVAVLPFANVSADPEQEFFSDGITDEISGALARIPDLRVVGRTSAFQYKTRNTDLRSIGQALNATHLIEGSVRKAGDRLRIAVQLILADSGLQLWSENYDRELTDVFAIQEDIARAIATSFNMRLSLAPGENLVSNRTKNLETYQDFLKGKAWLRARLSPASGPYLETLESVVAGDPSFAPAWAQLARAYSLEPGQSDVFYTGSAAQAAQFVKITLDKGEMAARKAIELDPESPGGYSGMAFIASNRGQWAVAEDNANKALAIDPNDPEALIAAAQAFQRTGYLRRSLPSFETAHTLEPLVPAFAITTAHAMRLNGQSGAAIALLESIPASVGRRNLFLARAYAAEGRYAEAADTVLLTRARDDEIRNFIEDVARILRAAPKPVEMPQWSPAWVGEWNFVYVPSGAFDHVMDYAEYQLAIGYPQDIGSILWQPEMAPLRKTARFKTHMRNAGLVDYWRERGWPDLCKPVGTNDFACE